MQVYWSIWHKTHNDDTNNVSSEGLDRHYHKYPAPPIGLAEILAIMSVSTFKIAVILYIVVILSNCNQFIIFWQDENIIW